MTAVSRTLIPRCGACGLLKKCQSPKMKPYLGGRVLIVGEAPGADEDRLGVPFIGKSGQLLRDTINQLGFSLNKDCSRTNAVICRPTTPYGKNRTPFDKEIDYCRPNLINAINQMKPEVIIPLGLVAIKGLMKWLWKERAKIGAIARWVGWKIPCQKINAWICPNWHPSHILREVDENPNSIIEMLFSKYLRGAMKCEGRPWKEIPDYKSKIKICTDTDHAAAEIRKILKRGKPICFDYETNMAKPDSSRAKILSCGLSNGETTIAYPMHGEASVASREMIESNLPKIGWNLKFEQRWTMKHFGVPMTQTDEDFDGMLGAHGLDNRRNITSVKFQAFVLLGQDSWDDHIKPYMKADSGNGVNKLHLLPLHDLLLYNGMDALTEWTVVERQKPKIWS